MVGSSPRPTLPSLLLSPSCLHCSHPAGRRPFLRRRRPRGRAASHPPRPPRTAQGRHGSAGAPRPNPSGAVRHHDAHVAGPCRLRVWYIRCSSAMSSSLASSAATSAPHSGRTEANTSLRSRGSHRRRTPCVRSNTLKSLDSADPKIDIQSRDLRLGFIFLRQDIHAPLTSWLPPPAPSKQQPGSMRALFRGYHLTLDRASWLKALRNLPGMTLELPS